LAKEIAFDRLLVVAPDGAAESILIVPALRALRAASPEAAITILASPDTAGAARLFPYIDRVMCKNGGNEEDHIRTIGSLRCTSAVVFTAPGVSPYPDAYRCYLAGIPVRAGESPEFGGAVLSHRIDPTPAAPTVNPVERYLSLVAALGVSPCGSGLELKVPPDLAGALDEAWGDRSDEEEESSVYLRCAPALCREAVAALVGARNVAVRSSGEGWALLDRHGEARAGVRPLPDAIDHQEDIERRGRRQNVHLLFAARAGLTVTGDALAARMAEAFGKDVIFLAGTGDSPPAYRPVHGSQAVAPATPLGIGNAILRRMKRRVSGR
jgi:ADP-heptose:LPS heptosyltransferase